jgi:hypothetical protein
LSRRNLAGVCCKTFSGARVIRSRARRIQTMIRSTGAVGFGERAEPVACPRLIDAVAASLAMASLWLCLIASLTMI